MGEARRRKLADPHYGTGWSGKPGARVHRHILDLLSEGPGGPQEMAKIAKLREMRSAFTATAEEEERLWPQEVYIPSAVMAIAGAFGSLRRSGSVGSAPTAQFESALMARVMEGDHTTSQLAVGMTAWRSGKTIYRFHAEMASELADTPMDRGMPVEVLRRLPQYGTYVEVKLELSKELREVMPEVFGMLAYYDMVDQPVHMTEETELTLSLVLRPIVDGRGQSEMVGELGGMMLTQPCAAIPLISGKTIEECIAIDGYRRIGKTEDLDRKNGWFGFYNMLLNMILYLCSEDPEIEAVREGQSAGGRRDLGSGEGEVEAWNVGMRIGAVLKKVKDDDAAGASGDGFSDARARPHIRKAHWHGYWYGPRRSASRDYRMRWVAPTLVNAESERDLVSTVRQVK